MKYKSICLAGEGWGAIAAYDGLVTEFNGLDVCSKDPEILGKLSKNDSEVPDLYSTKANLVVCAGYKLIVKKDFLLRNDVINIHYSLLPKYRGLHSTVWAILNDEEYLGLTIHKLNEYIDDGPIIYQYKIKNDCLSTATSYMHIFNKWITSNIGKILKDYLQGSIRPIPQNKDEATWVGKRNFEDCRIDFTKDHKYLKNFFRALNPPYPKPFFQVKGDTTVYMVDQADFLYRNIDTHIGRILNIDQNGIYVSSKDGYIVLKGIFLSSGERIGYNAFRIGRFLG